MDFAETEPCKEMPEPKRKQHFDDVLAIVGEFGRYQKLMVFLILLPALIPSGFLDWSLVFLTGTPPQYWCSSPDDISWGVDLQNGSLWIGEKRNGTERKECREPLNSSYGSGNISSSSETCQHGWTYDRSVYIETIVTEWDLVCEKKWYYRTAFARTMSALGGLIGPLIWSYFADCIGRKKGFFLCIAFQSVFSILTGFASNFYQFCVYRFCVGMTTSAGYTIPYDLLIEITGRKTRETLSILGSTCYTLGCVIFLIIAYFVRSWRMLSVATAVPSAVLFVLIWSFFPESPRWLLSRGRYGELEKFLLRVARINKRPLSAEFKTNLPKILRNMDTEDHTKSRNFLDLFRTVNMRNKTLILVFLNVCNKGVSRGLNYFAPKLDVDPYISAILTTIVSVPPYLMAQPAFSYLGRRVILFAALFIGSVACMATAIPSSFSVFILIMSLVAKFCITFTYLTGKLVEGEIFPTVVRSEGHSLVSVLSTAITAPVPYIVDLSDTFQIIPLLVFGTFCLVAAFLVFFLPETAHTRLPQTLEEGENFGKRVPWKEKFTLRPRRRSEACPVRPDEL